MADSHVKSKKKRKLTSPGEKQRPRKINVSIHSSEKEKELQEVRGDGFDRGKTSEARLEDPLWKNLQLILSLQSKEIHNKKKVELAFEFVKAKEAEGDGLHEDNQTVNLPRLIVFISDWIQSLLISPGDYIEACLDFRCWEVFKFCLEKAAELRVSLNLSRNLLKAICYIARNVLSKLNTVSLPPKDSFFIGQGFEVYSSVLKCVEMLFSFEGGLANENLDLWFPTIEATLELACKVYADKLGDVRTSAFVLKFCCLVLEPFSKFLRVHPTRKNGFRDFVDKLLGLLLNLLGFLHIQVDENTLGCRRTLLRLVQGILSHGLFHSAHIDGFLDSRVTEKYVASEDGESKSTKMTPRSYHRHFFDKLESVVANKNELELSSIGELLHLLILRVTKLRGGSNQSESDKHMGKTGYSKVEDDSSGRLSKLSSVNNDGLPEKSVTSSTMSAGTRKSVFDFFVQLMEPLLLEMHGYLQVGEEVEHVLSNVHCVLKSANGLLSSLIKERIYVKTEDISEGASLNFLKKVYSTIVSVASSLLSLQECSVDNNRLQRMFLLSAKELFVAVGHLLDVEYEVIEDDLAGVWLLILTYMVFCVSFLNTQDQCSITSQIIELGCRLLCLYSELRQVNNIIFALCKALRHLIAGNSDVGGGSYTKLFLYATSSPPETIAKSVEILISSQELRLAVCNAVKSIPEGQASGCIRQLMADILQSLEWIKLCSPMTDTKEPDPFILLTELLGRGLSEIYSLVLDSLGCTTGNCNLVGQSINNLMDVIRPSFSNLISPNPDCMKEFLFVVTGRNFETFAAKKRSQQRIVQTYWINVFFFRFYMSCRSLFRQAISFMPPDTAKKMADKMGDSVIACSGNDWIEKTDWNDEGYFSWIAQASATLMEIFRCNSHMCPEENMTDFGPLIYLLHAMALQRLGDLSRHIKSLNYLLQRNENLVNLKMMDDDTGLSHMKKKIRKLKKHVSILKQEAEELTDFMLGYLLVVADHQTVVCCSALPAINNCDKWEFCVSAINKSSLPTALWWIICQNVDVWCSYASKKKLKKFLSLLIRTSIPCISSSSHLPDPVGKHNLDENAQRKNLTIHHISLGLLVDSVLYEHHDVHRHLASVFCHIMETTVLQLFVDLCGGEIDFNSSPGWTEVLSMLEVSYNSGQKPNFNLHNKFPIGNCKVEDGLQTSTMKFTVCQSLLNLLCWMPKGYLKLKSFQLCATHTLNTERLVIVSLLRCQHKFSSCDMQNLCSLFVSCRRTLKNIIMTSCEKTAGDILSQLIPMRSDVAPLPLWLFKSLYMLIDLQLESIKDSGSKARDFVFSLVDHTSYIFLTISRCHFSRLVPMFIDPEQHCTGQDISNDVDGQNSSDGCDSETCKSMEDCRHFLALAEYLAKQAENLQLSLKNALCDENPGIEVSLETLNKLSLIVSCFGGFLWGLEAAAKGSVVTSNLNKAHPKWKSEQASKLGQYINGFSDFVNTSVHLFCVENEMWPEKQSNTQCSMKIDGNKPQLVLSEVDLDQTHYLKNHFLQCLLKGDYPEAAFALRQLLTASSAILRFYLQMNCIKLPPRLVSIVAGTSCVLLSGLADMVEVPKEFSFVWLDGVVKCLEEFGVHFPSTNPTLTRDLYSKLIELHLGAIGKCISLQGKGATLSSHLTESSTKLIHGSNQYPCRPDFLDEFKGRLRMSLKVFIEKSSELHLFSAVQAVERGLVGVSGACSVVYRIQTGDGDGGKVASTVAASVEALDLILEHASGRKRLNVVKRHIQSLISALFNIITHLQSPLTFCKKTVNEEDHDHPDAGSVLLMCVEVLTRISGKHALFQMDSWHISQCIHVPGALFQDLLTGCFVASVPGSHSLYLNYKQVLPLASTSNQTVDQEFSITLFAACCRLLHTVVKHHKSESERCLATLEESVSVLLHCLEIVVNQSLVRRGYFSWDVDEGVKCASFLRRIYEELRQQKDVFGQHCFKFLSSYIWVYSGCGPLKTGIRRVVDEALRPGVYALIDACSPNDLQYLHTVFGEGPCRNALATLQHDYKLNFQYEGKV